MRLQLSATVIAAAAIAAAFTSGIAAQSAALARASTSACAIAAASGVSEQHLTSGGRDRSYRLFVPPSYDGRTPLPLVLELHGSGGTAEGQAQTSRFTELAAREGFL